jgi:hypothetical protein
VESAVEPEVVPVVPAASDLLAAWERGLIDPGARTDALLAAVGLDEPGAVLPLGRRNRWLLEARRLLFGAVADVVAPCPGCGDQLEAEVSLPALLDGLPGTLADDAVTVRASGYDVALRLPTAADLVDLPDGAEPAAHVLLTRLVVDARRHGKRVDAAALPDTVARAADVALADADPAASLELAVSCPGCGADASLVLDPLTLLWDEVDAWGWRMLGEVHALAGAYGWTEADVLALTPTRRQAYLHLSGAGEGGG